MYKKFMGYDSKLYEDLGLMGYDVVPIGKTLSTFRRSLSSRITRRIRMSVNICQSARRLIPEGLNLRQRRSLSELQN
jgi:hypothetical protein